MQDASADIRLVLCTAPPHGGDKLGAQALARALVEAGVCACVNVVPGVESFYRWQGQVEHGQELLLLVKTTVAQLPRLHERIAALHPYEVPELIELPVTGGSAGYLAWLRSSVGSPPAAGA